MSSRSDVARRFVVQRHRARSDHYDFRLELDGVLVSWAVPKGPTLDHKRRRSAFKVEDHPLDYFDFEGVIPSGYGSGDVIVWDVGTWTPRDGDDPARALAEGDLHVDLFGEKLRGRFALVRRDDKVRDGRRESWLLLHKNDEHAVPGWEPGDHPRSVLTGRTNEEVKAAPQRVWTSHVEAIAGPTEDDLAALRDLGKGGTWAVFGRSLKLTNLDKVLFPGDPPVTKRELVEYAARIAPVVLPYLDDRALNMHRYPDGAQAKGFWHKERPSHAPEWVAGWDNPDADPGETETYVVVDEPATLVWAANFGALEWHPWTSRTERPDLPTYALFDIDPGERTTWDDVLVLARLHRDAFEHLGVAAYPKVTGRRGIQVVVPLRPGPTFEETRAWVESVSRTIGQVVPDLVSWKWEKKQRRGLARLDYTQNAVNKTLVAPYSPRPAYGAPVSAPITWDELDDPDLRPDRWTVRTIGDRLKERGDLFRPLLGDAQALPAVKG